MSIGNGLRKRSKTGKLGIVYVKTERRNFYRKNEINDGLLS